MTDPKLVQRVRLAQNGRSVRTIAAEVGVSFSNLSKLLRHPETRLTFRTHFLLRQWLGEVTDDDRTAMVQDTIRRAFKSGASLEDCMRYFALSRLAVEEILRRGVR